LTDISVEDFQRYKRCRQQWDFASSFRQDRYPAQPSKRSLNQSTYLQILKYALYEEEYCDPMFLMIAVKKILEDAHLDSCSRRVSNYTIYVGGYQGYN